LFESLQCKHQTFTREPSGAFFSNATALARDSPPKHGHKKAAMSNSILQQPNITIHPPPQLQEKNWMYDKPCHSHQEQF
jgi:hypothetical protein